MIREIRGAKCRNYSRYTCFKYCPIDEKVCRFCYPWPENANSSVTDVVILKDRDKKNRVRIRLIPEMNNGNVDATFVSSCIWPH